MAGLSARLAKYYRIVSSSVENFVSGTWNLVSNESIPKDASPDSLSWVVLDGSIQMVGGRAIVGNQGTVGGVNTEWFAYKVNGTKLHYRKSQTKIQLLVGSTWTDVITGLTANAKYTFSNYAGVSGNYLYIVGVDGIFKINTGSPLSYISLFNEADNFKGDALIDKGRMLLWNKTGPTIDTTGLYGSHVQDINNSSTYQTIASELIGTGDGVTTHFTHTLSTLGGGTAFNLLAIQTATPKTIKTITLDTSAQVTITSHGYSANDILYIGPIYDFMTGTGTVAVAGTSAVVGTGTHFLTDLNIGSLLSINSVLCHVLTITDDTHMTIDTSAITFTGAFVQYSMKQLGNTFVKVLSVLDPNNFTINVDTTLYQPYSNGGSSYKQTTVINDDYSGSFYDGAGDVTGTINYTTGAITLDFTVAPASGEKIILKSFQTEDSNSDGITDFRYSATRLALEGFVVRQDEGGDGIKQVLVGPDGKYYSFKSQSVYQFSISTDDLTISNQVFRKDIGIPSKNSCVSTGIGILFMNTANASKPLLTILTPNTLGDNLIPKTLFPQFKFEKYTYDSDTVVDFFDRFVLVSCKSQGATSNDTLLIGNVAKNNIQATPYGSSCFAKDGINLYAGSPLENTTYQIFNGFDDLGNPIENYYETRGEFFGDNSYLHKVRRIRLAGLIDRSQWYEVLASFDDSDYQWIGSIRGDGNYVDYSNPQVVGVNMVGTAEVGGDLGTTVYPYYTEIKVGKQSKWRKCSLKFVGQGIGFVSIRRFEHWDILHFDERLPSRYRQKQNVSLDGTQTDLPTPDH